MKRILPNARIVDARTLCKGFSMASSEERSFWRSPEELADSQGLRALLENEFPEDATEWADPVSRRRFLSLMGAGLALAGVTGCSSAPREKILPYVRQPEGVVPGKALYYATAMTVGGYATGVLVKSQLGRP